MKTNHLLIGGAVAAFLFLNHKAKAKAAAANKAADQTPVGAKKRNLVAGQLK